MPSTTPRIDVNTIFQSLHLLYIVVAADDPDFTILEENQAHAAAGMADRNEVVGRPLLEVFPDTSEEYAKTGTSRLIESIRMVIKTKQPNSMPDLKYDLRDEQGVYNPKYWHVTHYPILGKDDKVIAVYQETKDIIDITEQEKTEHALAESESRLRFMADSMPQLVWVTGPEGQPEYHNQPWYQFTGTNPDEVNKENWSDLIHPDDRDRAWRVWQHSLKTGAPYEIEYRLYHAPSKTYRWVIGRALPFRSESGAIVKWYGTSTDINEQKHAAELQKFLADVSKVLSTTLNYKAMLKNITQVCVPAVADWCTVDLYSKEKGFEQVSVAHVDPKKVKLAREYRKHNQVHIDDPTGVPNVIRTGRSEYYPRISDELLEQYIEDKKSLEFMKSLELRSIIIAPLRIKNEVVGGLSLVSSDSGRYYTESDLKMAEELAARISLILTNSRLYADSIATLKERKKLQKELLLEKQRLEVRVKERTQQLQLTNEGLRKEILKRHAIEEELQAYSEELVRSNAELEDFAYIASHDLQEPLRKIQAFGNLLKSEYGNQLGGGIDYVDRMDAAAQRMSTLIQDLLSFSRVTSRINPTEKIDFKAIIEDVLDDLETRIEEVKGKVVIKGALPTFIADPTHIRQLVQNLIGNSLKFHKPDTPPVVEISANTSDKNWLELRFKDNGIGFHEKYLDKIFSVFQRLHGREAYEGTGIGLAVCRKIVEQYGGSITAESEKNKGATFIVRLPKKRRSK